MSEIKFSFNLAKVPGPLGRELPISLTRGEAIQEDQHFLLSSVAALKNCIRETSRISKGPGYQKMVVKMNKSLQSSAIISSSNSDQLKEEKQQSIGTDKLWLARHPPAELRQRISHHKPTRRATPI
ncbi:hypothetical protein DV515_00005792 [Chloebia gouldiae]|uniref:Uncharacterized protein n=1 Tax=Chloebia gouldiae TaxID=44316 RepID=A0A3L8SMK4_CHLGU|nr:hypothetical protein DV515_00005792 [Chloebia gouldiae]